MLQCQIPSQQRINQCITYRMKTLLAAIRNLKGNNQRIVSRIIGILGFLCADSDSMPPGKNFAERIDAAKLS